MAIYLLTYLLTPCCRVLLEKLTDLQLIKKFPAFHGTRRLITALTSVRHLSLSCASPIQSIYLHPTSWRSILILSTHLRLGLLPSGFPTKILYTPLSSPVRATNQMETILRIRSSFFVQEKMWIRSQGWRLLDHNAVKFCRRTLTIARNDMPLSSRYKYNYETPVPMNPTTRRHIPEDRNRDVLSRRQDLRTHIQRAHQFVHTKSYRICVAAHCSRKVNFANQPKESATRQYKTTWRS